MDLIDKLLYANDILVVVGMILFIAMVPILIAYWIVALIKERKGNQ